MAEPARLSESRAYDMLTELTRTDFRVFLRRVFKTVSPGVELVWEWYLDAICDHLEALRRGEITKLIINQPPRTLKSIATSVALPAWLFGHNPSVQFIGASYSSDLAIKMSVDTRLVLESQWYQDAFPLVKLSDDQNQKWRYLTDKMGSRTAVSVGSKVTGFGADYIAIDDPESPNEALSDAVRNSTNEWIRLNLLTRFNTPGQERIALTQQRVHEDDTTGSLLRDGGWTHLCLPFEFPKKTIIENPLKKFDPKKEDWVKEEGELLAPTRMNEEFGKQMVIKLGEYGFAGQFLQSPAPLEGGLVKMNWFKRYAERPLTFQYIVHSWDTAQKANAGSDYSCLTVWGVRHNGFYLLEVYNEKLEYPFLKDKVVEFYEHDRPYMVVVEDKASGISLIQDVGANMRIPITGMIPHKDKIQRLSEVSDQVEGGNVWLPEYAHWLQKFEEQLKFFPNSRKKDMVDSFSQFLKWAKNRFDFTEENMDNPWEREAHEQVVSDMGRNPVTGY